MMTKLEQAARKALVALGEIEWSNNSQWQSDRAKTTITALREALEAAHQPAAAEQAPVGHLYCGGQFGNELDEWEIEPEQYQCDRLNEHFGTLGKKARIPLYAAPKVEAVEQEPVVWTANEWSVFNSGAEVASGLSLNEAMDYLTDERAAREWSVVCVINKDNMPTPAAPQPTRQPLTDKQIDSMVATASLAERDMFRRFARAIERTIEIGGEV